MSDEIEATIMLQLKMHEKIEIERMNAFRNYVTETMDGIFDEMGIKASVVWKEES